MGKKPPKLKARCVIKKMTHKPKQKDKEAAEFY